MKIAVVYNRDSEKVINFLGLRNQERYGKKAIARVVDSLRAGGHQVAAFEGDKDLIANLENFMPRVVKGERPGMVFNLAYGIQGQARYTHVPGILEMVGIPYVGSGPMAHSLALDKVVSKMIFLQHGLPTPEFAVLETPGQAIPDMAYPLIVKPRNEAVSFGLKIVHDEAELRAAAAVIFDRFRQAVLVERFIEGREINVGLLGNAPAMALPPAELVFGAGGPTVYTYEDKTRRSGREVGIRCPADLDEAQTLHAQDVARRAFESLGCADCARVDMRMDGDGNLYILEINSLPSLGEHGSYVAAAESIGLDFAGLINRLVEVASTRYFGTPQPPELVDGDKDPARAVFSFVTSRRERIEARIREWTARTSRSSDPVGIRAAVKQLDKAMTEIGLRPVAELTDPPEVATWETAAGFAGGTLLIGQLDVPLAAEVVVPQFSRDPEFLHGEGVGSSRAPLAMLEFALRGLRHVRRLRKSKIGVLYYTDEGQDCALSAEFIRRAAGLARHVLVLRPANKGEKTVLQRRGLRRYQIAVTGESQRVGQSGRRELMRWLWDRLEQCCALSSRKDRIAVSVGSLETRSYRMLLPHEVRGSILVSYLDPARADATAERCAAILKGRRDGIRVRIEPLSDRPPMPERAANRELFELLRATAADWELPCEEDSSLLPSVAGLVPEDTAVLCGVGPSSTDLFTAQESVQRISVVQRTLLLAEFLLRIGREDS